MKIGILDNAEFRIVRSKNYNYSFRKEDGFFARWGKTLEDDPIVGPSGEILDIEITERCDGGCAFCYKGNTPQGPNMSLETFQKIIDKLPKILCQCAIGADATGTANPDMFAMMEYARKAGVIPNLTIADVSDSVADRLAELCGAVAVSYYNTKRFGYGEACAESVKKLTDRGMNQVNIHYMISKETYEDALKLLEKVKVDPRFRKLRAIVFLSLKQKGRGSSGFTPLSQNEFTYLISKAMSTEVNWGCDSCSAHKTFEALKSLGRFEEFKSFVEPCESTLFSTYVNVHGEFFPCSFTEGTEGWERGIDVVNCKNFIKDVWQHPRTQVFRKKLLLKERNCPIYEI